MNYLVNINQPEYLSPSIDDMLEEVKFNYPNIPDELDNSIVLFLSQIQIKMRRYNISFSKLVLKKLLQLIPIKLLPADQDAMQKYLVYQFSINNCINFVDLSRCMREKLLHLIQTRKAEEIMQ